MFEIRNPFGLLGELFPKPLVLALQSFNLVRLAILRRLWWLRVIASASLRHATFMADSRQKYNYGILDLRNWSRTPPVPELLHVIHIVDSQFLSE